MLFNDAVWHRNGEVDIVRLLHQDGYWQGVDIGGGEHSCRDAYRTPQAAATARKETRR